MRDLPRFLLPHLRRSVALLALWFIAVYLFISLVRMRFPFQLEWIEGAMVDQALRAFKGEPMFIRPNATFIPQIYTPLYYYASALVMHITGPGFLPLRLVSWLSSLGFLAVLFVWARKETGRAEFGLLAAGFMAACYKISGSWFDVARVDSFFVFLTVMAAFAVRFSSRGRQWVLAGICVYAAWLAKQTATTVFLPVGVALFLIQPKKALTIFGTAAVLCAASFAWMDHTSGGWSSYYFIKFAGALAADYEIARFWRYWTKDLFGLVPWALFFAASYLIGQIKDRQRLLFYGSYLAGAMLTSCLARIHWGGAENVLMLVYAALAVMLSIGAAHLADKLTAQNRTALVTLVYALCIVQLASLAYTPVSRIPKKIDYESGEALMKAMRAYPGELFAPRFGYLPLLAGKRTYVQQSMLDLTVFYDAEFGPRLHREVEAMIERKEFGAIIFESKLFQKAVEAHYTKGPAIPIKGSKFWAPGDARNVYVPKERGT